MSIKPSSLPRWASVDTVNGITGQNNVIEPAEAKKDLGWDYLEKPARNYMNWAQRTSYLNLEYLINEIDNFAPHESDPQAMTITVDAGRIIAIGDVVSKAVQTTATIVAPAGNPRIDRVVVDTTTGIISVITGSEAASPSAPTIPDGKHPICQVLLDDSPATTVITDSLITDERSITMGTSANTNEIIPGLWKFNNGITLFNDGTAKAWASSQSAIQIGGNGALWGNKAATVGGTTYLSQNMYFDGANFKYISTDEASFVRQVNGQVEIHSAVSGSADANITFIEVITTGLSTNGAEVLSIGKASFESWISNYAVMQIGGNGSIIANSAEAASNEFLTIQNAYHNGTNWKYTVTDEASYVRQTAGTHRWHSAASGTADATIIWTETMRTGLSSNGAEVLSIGKASFENWSTNYSTLQVGGSGAILSNQAAGAGGNLFISQNAYHDGAWKYQDTDEASYYQQGSGAHVLYSAPSGTADTTITWTETMRTGLSTAGAEVLSVGKGSFENWISSFSTLQLGDTAAIVGHPSILYNMQNAYYDGAFKYTTTNSASYSTQSGGNHTLYSTASGTADTTITWTETMRTGLSTAGAEVLSIGKGSFENYSSLWSVIQVGGNGSIIANATEGAGQGVYFVQNSYHDGTNWKAISTDEASGYYQFAGEHVFRSVGVTTAGATITWSERFRIENDGTIKGFGGDWLISHAGGDITPARELVVYASSGVSFMQFSRSTSGSTVTDGFQLGLDSINQATIMNEENTKLFIGTSGNISLIFATTGGMYTPTATGGDKGDETINAKAVYDDNVLLTDYVFDLLLDGEIKDEDSVQAEKLLDNPSMLDINSFTEFWKDNHSLPSMPTREEFKADRPSIGALAQRLWETVELQAVHISQLNDRLNHLES